MISLEAAAHPPVFARARAVARYDSEAARGLVSRLKFYDRLELAEPMGRWMARAGAELLADADLLRRRRCTGCVSPPGASTSRRRWRG